jgi:hypothetical protein
MPAQNLKAGEEENSEVDFDNCQLSILLRRVIRSQV